MQAQYPGLHHGTVDQELLLRNEYLAAENRVLGGKLKGRRRKRRTELLHRGSLDNCHLCDGFNFLTIREPPGPCFQATSPMSGTAPFTPRPSQRAW
jgi:hypothetical protein